MHESLQSLQAVIDSIDAIVYVADMKTYEILLINNYTRRLFGGIQGRKCRASFSSRDKQGHVISAPIASWLGLTAYLLRHTSGTFKIQ